ncbi:hypothetical protein ACFV8T_44420 [Streptomyces sp. NPDC059832]|uniref:hypothetical protein n=1 Tax=Streptomyces sp. NPDC059832 TaxID=3346966 RepID=UPI00364E37EA
MQAIGRVLRQKPGQGKLSSLIVHPEWEAALRAVDEDWNPEWPADWQRHFAVEALPDGTEVKLGVFLSNSKSRRAKLTADKLQALASLGLDWAA